ncbi:MAG TPA: hypothetical protein VGD21_00070 [Lysobacter sp.]
MKASVRMAVLSLSILGLAACASTAEKSAYVAPPKADSIMDNDELYMDIVERTARRRGIDVVWVNPPRKQIVAATDD